MVNKSFIHRRPQINLIGGTQGTGGGGVVPIFLYIFCHVFPPAGRNYSGNRWPSLPDHIKLAILAIHAGIKAMKYFQKLVGQIN